MTQDFIDLRSDTVTKPTKAMREAMAAAEVGDDVYGEDPTVNKLQRMAAAMLSKEAGLFVPSGTMGNLIAVLTHCDRGDEVIMGDKAHTFIFEGGGISALGGVHPHTIPNQHDGTLRLEDIRAAIRSDDPHFPISKLLILENTHNRCGGVPISAEYTKAAADLAHEHGLYLHLDGARIFNAAAHYWVPASRLALCADSVTFCLSKALCAPVGSVLCGSEAFIKKARRIRKQLGGGMRQAGVLAAAGIVALDQMVDRIHEDHDKALKLAKGLENISGIMLEPGSPATNMVFISLSDNVPLDAPAVRDRLLEHGVKVSAIAARRFRLVCHYWITEDDLKYVENAFRQVLNGTEEETLLMP